MDENLRVPDNGKKFAFAKISPEESVAQVNRIIEKSSSYIDKNQISDGYHTFGELYDHRITLWMALCRLISITPAFQNSFQIWKSKTQSDGISFDGWFILGINKLDGKQLTYHLPISEWENCWFADTLQKAHTWDGHSSADVLSRIAELI